MASVRSCMKLPLCPVEPMSAGSTTALPLAKAKPISGSDSVFKIGKKRKPAISAGERSENM